MHGGSRLNRNPSLGALLRDEEAGAPPPPMGSRATAGVRQRQITAPKKKRRRKREEEKGGLTRVVKGFFDETTIHGLRYLVQGDVHPIIKLIWFACITVCISLAVVLTINTVEEWRNSPSVVTGVKPALAADFESFPVVALCPPQSANSVSLLYNLLGKGGNGSRHVSDGLGGALLAPALTGDVAEACRSKSYFDWDAKWEVEDIFFECLDDEFEGKNITDGCKFIHALALIQSEKEDRDVDYYERSQRPDADAVVRTYLNEVSAKEDKTLSIEGLIASAEAQIGVNGTADREVDDYVFYYYLDELLYAYVCLYPKKGFTDDTFLEEPFPRPITDYTFQSIPEVTKEETASLALTLLDRGAFAYDNTNLEKHKWSFSLDMLDSAAASLGIDGLDRADHSVNNEADPILTHPLIKLTNAFHLESYMNDGHGLPFFNFYDVDWLEEPPGDEYWHPCGNPANFTSLEDACEAAEDDDACSQYCQMVRAAQEDKQEALKVLFETGLDEFGSLLEEHTHSLLPGCLKQDADGDVQELSDGCWKRMVTDRGTCFFHNYYVNASDEVTAYDYFYFVVDPSFDRIMREGKRDPVAILYPPHHFAAGKYLDTDNVVKDINNGEDHNYHNSWTAAVKVEFVAESTPEFKDMSPGRRRCLFPRERELDYFPTYTRANCQLECAWEKARRRCGCVPWSLLDQFPDSSMCERYGNWCFQRTVGARFDEDDENNCVSADECPLDCEDVEFSVEWEELIDIDEKMEEGPLRLRPNFPDSIMDKAEIVESSEVGQSTFHHIEVSLDSKRTLVITTTASATLVDIVSNIGGTLGLFCGFSILSAVELIYWSCKAILKRM